MAARSHRQSRRTHAQTDEEYVRGGKGRRDDVRGSGIYPASSPKAPRDARITTEADLVKHRPPKR